MRIRDILRSKGTDVITVEPDEPVLTAARTLAEQQIGALLVCTGDDIEGIITERDLLNLMARASDAVEDTLVRDVMTSELVTGKLEDDLVRAMDLMMENGIRHLPVVEDGQLGGLISVRDILNTLRSSVETENQQLKRYIQGVRA